MKWFLSILLLFACNSWAAPLEERGLVIYKSPNGGDYTEVFTFNQGRQKNLFDTELLLINGSRYSITTSGIIAMFVYPSPSEKLDAFPIESQIQQLELLIKKYPKHSTVLKSALDRFNSFYTFRKANPTVGVVENQPAVVTSLPNESIVGPNTSSASGKNTFTKNSSGQQNAETQHLSREQIDWKIEQINQKIAGLQHVFQVVFIPSNSKQRRDIEAQIQDLQNQKKQLINSSSGANSGAVNPSAATSVNRKSESSNEVRAAADAYIASLVKQGVVFASEFRAIINYNLSPPKSEAIYTLDYLTQGGQRLVGAYTITLQQRSDGWCAIGGTPGDRRNNFNDPVIGNDGVIRRSPMEQAAGNAMGQPGR